MNLEQWEAFVAGMVYAGGPKAAQEALDALDLRELALSGAELIAEHGIMVSDGRTLVEDIAHTLNTRK